MGKGKPINNNRCKGNHPYSGYFLLASPWGEISEALPVADEAS
jgi:hypothetical protein